MEAVLFPGLEVLQSNPEIVAVALQLVVVRQFPVGHITDKEHIGNRLRLRPGIDAQRCLGLVGVIGDTHVYTRRTRGRLARPWGKTVPYIRRRFFADEDQYVRSGRSLTFLGTTGAIVEHKSQCHNLCGRRYVIKRIDIRDGQLPFVADFGQLRRIGGTPTGDGIFPVAGRFTLRSDQTRVGITLGSTHHTSVTLGGVEGNDHLACISRLNDVGRDRHLGIQRDRKEPTQKA